MVAGQPGAGQDALGDDQLHSSQPAGLQRAQKRRPVGAILAVADGEAEHLAVAVAAHPGGDHDGLGDHPAVDPGLAVGRVHEHIREALAGQGSVPERANLAVEVGADPGDLALADAAVGTQGFDEVVDLSGADPVQVGLHDHHEQRLIDPAAPFQQRREERSDP
jgi:hypothetical protein